MKYFYDGGGRQKDKHYNDTLYTIRLTSFLAKTRLKMGNHNLKRKEAV